MNRTSNNNLLRVATLLFFFLAASQVCMASEGVPLLPMTVQGTTLVDGTPAHVGTTVVAYLNGEQAGKFTASSSSGEYCFWISGTAADEGKPIKFAVNGKDTGKILAWKSGRQVFSLQLSVGEGANPEGYIKSLTSFIDSELLTKTEKPKALGKDSESRVIESSVPEPDVKILRCMRASCLVKGAAEVAGDSSKLKIAPGFTITYAAAGIIVLIFGLNLVRKRV